MFNMLKTPKALSLPFLHVEGHCYDDYSYFYFSPAPAPTPTLLLILLLLLPIVLLFDGTLFWHVSFENHTRGVVFEKQKPPS